PAADGAVTVDVAAAAATDSAGNDSTAATQFSITNDASAPTVSIASAPPASVNGPFDLVFNFTEDMTGLTAADFVVTNGAVVLSGGPRDFTVTVTPNGNGDITLALPANVATDAAGNGNVAFAAAITVNVDTAAPSVSIASTSSDPVSGAFPITVTFNEDVSGFVLGDLTVGNGA
ncbi:Ig-like domain-containing protein, partial [Algimonas arctica]|uniref:Ig-like domain-containing protein n=1 Tax=Algimonas arctica TaxID=1479486 RepID=UPI001F3A6B61